MADWDLVQPVPRAVDEKGRRRRGRPGVLGGLRWLVHLAVLTQRCSKVVLPDVLLAQCVWGDQAHWPANWRRRLIKYFFGKLPKEKRGEKLVPECLPACPLCGRTDIPHQHLAPKVLKPEESLGCLLLFKAGHDNDTGVDTFDFSKPIGGSTEEESKQLQDLVKGFRRLGQLTSVYLPILVFGPSPRLGLSCEQRQILTALTHETTRAKRTDREDKAEIVVGGREPDRREASPLAGCPFLEEGRAYIAFNGNGRGRRRHYHGQGYHLIGREGGGWLERAGYEVPQDLAKRWQTVRRFLKDLQALSGDFGLVAAGFHKEKSEWHSLAEMIILTRTRIGRNWLKGCLLRVYTGADYLTRWRQHFAELMGFSFIPGGAELKPPAPSLPVTAIGSANDLALWMSRHGWTDGKLAKLLGVSRSLVSQYRSGRRPWSQEFQDRLARALPTLEITAKDRKDQVEGSGPPND